jgi:spore coat protein CotH
MNAEVVRGTLVSWVFVVAVSTAVAAGCGGGSPGSQTGGVSGGGGGDSGSIPSDNRPEPAFPIFDQGRVHTVDLTMSPADWQSIIDDTRGDEWRHATLKYDGVVVEEVGVRPSGESSRLAGNPKMSIRIKFDAFGGRGKFGGRKAIKVDGMSADLSMLRERLAFFVCASQIPTPSEATGRLTVNGDLRGHYTIVEVWDSEAIEERFSEPIGPLYRIRGKPMTDPYLYVGPDPAAYVPVPWEPYIAQPARGDDVVPPYLQALANAPDTIADFTDLEGMLAFFACNVIAMNTDGLTGDTDVEDHFQYFDPSTGKFVILPWDPDNTFGSFGETPDRYIFARFSRSTPGRLLRDNAEMRARYEAKIRSVMEAVPLSALHAEIDRIYQEIRDVVYEDPIKPFSNNSFEWAIGFVRDFATQRYAYLRSAVGQ